MVYWAMIIFSSLHLHKQCLAADSKDLAPWLNELSEQNLLNLVNVSDKSYNHVLSKGEDEKPRGLPMPLQYYYHIDPKAMLRQRPQEEEDPTIKNQKIVHAMESADPGKDYVKKACYTIQITWRRAKRDFHRYFTTREYYESSHYFEIGYLTHVIVSKYMNILELYDMVDQRFIKNPTKNYGPTSWVWYIYTNILEYSRAIIHWCNMMHEIKSKYGVESGTTKSGPDYETITVPNPEDMEVDKFVKSLHTNYQAELAAKKKKQLESRLHYKYGMRKPSMNLTTVKTKRPPRFWKWRPPIGGSGKDYGWSKEDFFD